MPLPTVTLRQLSENVTDTSLSTARIIQGPWARRGEISLTLHSSFEAAERVWRKLEAEGDCTAFQSFGWLSAWQRHIGAAQKIEPCIVSGNDFNGEPLFLLPLGLKSGFMGRRLIWLGGDLADYQGPLLAADFSRNIGNFADVWSRIRSMLPAHDIIEFSRQMEMLGGQVNPFLRGGAVMRNASSAHITRLAASWDAYYGQKRSSGSKKRDRQKRRKMEELGAVSLVTPEREADILVTLDALIAQKSAAFARMGCPNLFNRPGYRNFYKDLAVNPATRDMIHVCHLQVGDRIAAANWGISFKGRYSYVLASYAEQHEASRFGPGMVLLMELMRSATEAGHTEFDFTVGDEAYKGDWCEVEVPLYDRLEAVTVLGWLVLLPKLAFRKLKRFVKQTPVLWDAFTRLRAWTGPIAA